MADKFSTLLQLENLNGGKKLYFASDFHLGAPNEKRSQDRERVIVQWLNEIEDTASHIFLVGDIFDLSQEMIRQYELSAFDKIREKYDGDLKIYLEE